MLSERITKMDFVFVNTSAEQKVSKKETQGTESKDFNSYLKSDTAKTTETKETQTKTEEIDPKEVSSNEETKLGEFKRLLKGNESEITENQTELETQALIGIIPEEIKVTPEVYELVLSGIKDIVEIIQETFNVSEQEIETALDDLGLNKLDLLSGTGLNELLSKISPNGEISNLLVNSEFSKAAKEMFTVIDNLKETIKSDFSLSDQEITNIFKTLKENLEPSNKTITIADVTPKQVNITENQNVIVEEDNAYQTENTDSSESKNNTGNNNSSNDLSQGIMTKITEALENISTDDVDPVKIMKQIIDEIKLTVKQDMTKLEMQLYPEQLGKISLQVMSKDGIVTAQIAAQTTAVKEALEGQLFILKQNMEEQGIKVDSIEVTLASPGFQQNSESQEGEAGKNDFKKSRLLGTFGEVEEEVSLEEQLMEDSGSTVSYKA